MSRGAPMRGRRIGFNCTWHGDPAVAIHATWGPWRGLGAFDFDVRRVGDRWRAVVERVSPRVRREATDETRDEAALWCEETAWGIYCEETTR